MVVVLWELWGRDDEASSSTTAVEILVGFLASRAINEATWVSQSRERDDEAFFSLSTTAVEILVGFLASRAINVATWVSQSQYVVGAAVAAESSVVAVTARTGFRWSSSAPLVGGGAGRCWLAFMMEDNTVAEAG